jgi:hypothetical protein
MRKNIQHAHFSQCSIVGMPEVDLKNILEMLFFEEVPSSTYFKLKTYQYVV